VNEANVPGTGTSGAAFFDLDKTLIEGSSAVHFARAAYRAGVLRRRDLARALWANVRFRLEGSTDQASDVLAGLLPRLYPEMLREAWAHQDAGRPAYIVTAASQEIAETLAHVLVFDGGIGTRSEVEDGRYTGRPGGPFTYREGKAEAIREMAAAEGIDLAESFAYSDSESDLPMLRLVGNPVVVNPDAQLRRTAVAEGWRVIHFDKLRRRLRIAAGAAAVGLLGTGGGWAAGRIAERRGRGAARLLPR
jgi:HAD superfamily phosphoserine phosphatase-like hydrolase